MSRELAVKYELANRIHHQDSRRIIFSQQEYLLGLLSVKWKEKCHEENATRVKPHPYDDFSFDRAVRCSQLREKGHSPEDAWEIACKKYPLPDVLDL